METFSKGDKVVYSSNASVGEITGLYRERMDAWEVLFNGVDRLYIPTEKLSKFTPCRNIYDYFQKEEFNSISDLRRRIYRYRMSGELTNLMYSMDNAVAEFMPHQFIPVIKFLESYTDRLLIADEVGLGKTIEAMYIWEELRARKNAKRLLAVVPAVLREKWMCDMHKFFGINADIVSAQSASNEKSLLHCIREAANDPDRYSFALIVSLEGLRSAKETVEFLEKCRDTVPLFDMTIIDEAHYLRNSKTKSFMTGELLRDVSNHLVLLSATPIQTSSKNFFNLLHLLAPEEYEEFGTFGEQLEENKPLVNIANALERGAKSSELRAWIQMALNNPVFRHDSDLLMFERDVDKIACDTHERVVMTDRIKSKYFYSGLVTRSRKRDVFPGRTERVVTSVNFRMNDYEYSFYQKVSSFLQEEWRKIEEKENVNDFSAFRLIARQRQMASCIPAALMAWRGIDIEYDIEEIYGNDNSEESGDEAANSKDKYVRMPPFKEFDLERLDDQDSKFATVLAKIKDILRNNPDEKIVIFSFFRHTVKYVFNKLEKNGINSTFIMGGMTLEEKTARIEDFAGPSVNVLVSSEVGSEGIDLQFARFELNYDLPWNPMRLEQRIGRIDRIGQKSPKIFICNAYCENTIEDRILQRLYERIEIVRTTIGDLEEIMGETIRNLEMDIFREGCKDTQEAIDAKAEQVVSALCHQQEMAKKLELEAGIMASPYQEFILKNIDKSYKINRKMTSEELMFFCKDILEEKFQGSKVDQIDKTSMAEVRLSDLGRRELTKFIADNPIASGTQLHCSPKGFICNFGKKVTGNQGPAPYMEFIDANHPLIRFLRSVVDKNALFTTGCEAVSIKRSDIPKDVDVQPGYYAYGIQRWEADGVKNVNELRYLLAPGVYDEASTPRFFSYNNSEMIMVSVIMKGRHYDINMLSPEEYNACGMALQAISEKFENDFCDFDNDYRHRNEDLIKEQSKYVERTANKKASGITDTINKHQRRLDVWNQCGHDILGDREENLSNGSKKRSISKKQLEVFIKGNEARRDKIIERRDHRINAIKDKLNCSPIHQEIAIGILEVKEV